MESIRVLLVDDELASREPMKLWLEAKGFQVDEASNPEEALRQVGQLQGNYVAALVDQVLGLGPDGIETMKMIHNACPNLPVIIFTGWSVQQEAGIRALREGAIRYLLKPVNPEEIEILIRSIVESREVQYQLELTQKEREWLNTLLKVSQSMQRQMGSKEAVLDTIADAAKKLTNAEECAICVRNPLTNRYELTASVDGVMFTEEFRKSMREIGLMALEREGPQNIPDTMADARVQSPIWEAKIRSMLAVPIEKDAGVLYVFGKERHQFGDEAVYLLEMLASQAAIAFKNAALFQENERRVRELEKLREVSTLTAKAVELTEVLRQIAAGVKSLLGADSAAIWGYDATRKRFISSQRIADGIPESESASLSEEPTPGGVTETIMKSGFKFIQDIENPAYQFIGEKARAFYRRVGIKCFAGIALNAGDEAVGVIYLNFNTPREFSEEDRATLQSFADEAALAIKKARFYQQFQQALRHLETAAEFMRLEEVEKVLPKVLPEVVDGVMEVLECDAVTLYRYDESKKTIIVPPVTRGLRDEAAVRDMRVTPHSTLGKTLQKGEHFADDVESDEVMMGEFIRREGIHSSAGIALRVGSHTVGILFINYRSPYHFTEDDKKLSRAFATQAAVAIYNAELYKKAQKRIEHLRCLYKASQTTSIYEDKDEILNTLLEEALNITEISDSRASFGNFQTYQPETDELIFTHARPEGVLQDIKQKIGHRFSLDKGLNGKLGIIGRAIKTGKTQLVPDVKNDADYISYHEKTRSEIAIPLKLGERIFGALNIEHEEVGGLDEEDSTALEMLANLSVIAIQKAERIEQLKQTQQILASRTTLAYMGMASSTWRHEINKDASTISDNISLIRKKMAGNIFQFALSSRKRKKQIEQYLRRIESMAKRIRETPLTAPLSAEEGVEPIPVNELIRERVTRLLEARQILQEGFAVKVEWEVTLPDAARIRASREWLRRAFDIVIENALEAMQDAPEKRLMVKTFQRENQAEIRIIDAGPGIPQRIVEKLFREPVPKQQGEKGSGMGLMLAQLIIQTYKGNIRLLSTVSAGTEMGISFPLA